MSNDTNNETFDLGSEPAGEVFDPFAEDNEETPEENNEEITVENAVPVTEQPKTPATEKKPVTPETKTTDTENFADKPPVFEYAGATENIDDSSKTFDELRIEKSADFPELEDGKRVSWTVEYGKITRAVGDPKGTSIGKIKSDIETSKEFAESLKKRGADKNPVCKVKPRVTAQSKGNKTSYRGVFTDVEEAEASGKMISVVPAKDGRIYEIRKTNMGKFITPITNGYILSDVQAGFTPALPLIPMDLTLSVYGFFRAYMQNGDEREVLVNIYWDTEEKRFIADAPEQTVTKASVDSKTDGVYSGERYIHYMDIHSHNSMKAFFSETDNNDERATRLYSVIGRLDKFYPDIKTRISNGGKFLEIDPSEVFEKIAKPFPDEWKSRVKFPNMETGDGL